MATMAAVIGLWVASFYKGQVDIAIYGMNWAGHICGKGVTASAPFQVWINPTVTASLFQTAVCMPHCPIINSTTHLPANDTATIETLETAIGQLSAGNAKTKAEVAISTLDTRVGQLKSEVDYMSTQLGDTSAELDRSTMFCLCNKKAYPDFLAHNANGIDVQALCGQSQASARGYIELPYDDSLSTFVGSGSNLAEDPEVMSKIPCAFKYRTVPTFTRCSPWLSGNSLGRLTLAKGTSGVSDAVSSVYNAASQRIVGITTDISKGSHVLWYACGIALAASIILIYVMSCSCYEDSCQLLTWIVWGVLYGLLVILVGLTSFTVHEFQFYRDRYETTPALATQPEDEYSMYLYGVGMCLSGLMMLCHLVFILPCVCGDNINRAISIIAAASQVFDHAWGLLFYPIFHNIALLIAIGCWLIGLVFIGTAGEVVVQSNGVHTLDYNENFQNAIVFYVLSIVWIVEFMGAVGFMVICGAILIAFFDPPRVDSSGNERGGKTSPIWDSLYLVLGNHLGTAAIGSFFITLVVLIRAALTYLIEYANDNSENEWIAYIRACFQCICECIETCMRYMVTTAYILTVLEGRWFFSAVCGGLSTLIANMGTVMATNYIAFVILWLCKLAVPLGSTTVAYFMLKSGNFGVTDTDLTSSFNLLVPIFIISCLFSFTFMNLLGISIDVVMIAFLKVEQMDQDHPELKILNKEDPENSKIPKSCLQSFRNFLDAKEATKEARAETQPLMANTSKSQV